MQLLGQVSSKIKELKLSTVYPMKTGSLWEMKPKDIQDQIALSLLMKP